MKTLIPLLSLAILGHAVAADAAKPVVINLATILPNGTSGHQRLMELRDAWKGASGQAVNLVIKVGTGEGEQQIVRQMKGGRYQAALISAVGLAEIEKSATCLQLIPMQFHNWAELDYAREKMRGELERRLREQNFEVLFWADAGWVRFFSKTPAVRPADFKPLKMFVWSGDEKQQTMLRSLGYNPVGVETEGILPALTTGMINAVPIPPFIAAAGQFNKHLGHMVDLKWVPLIGAAVVRRDVWERIPAAVRVNLLKAADVTGETVRQRGRMEDEEAIVALKERGLVVHSVTPEIAAEWQATAAKAYPMIRGSTVPADLFDRVQQFVAEYRAAHGEPAK